MSVRQIFLRYIGAEVANFRAHVAMRELEPRAREGICKLIGIFVKTTRDFFVRGIEAQCEIGCKHCGRVAACRIVRVGNCVGTGTIFRRPLMRATRTLREFPLVTKQMIEETVAPLRGC